MRTLLTTVLLAVASLSSAEQPPPSSPTALGQHPRLIVTAGNRKAIRDYVDANYRKQFQDFLTMLGRGLTGQPNADAQKVIENTWGPINYAFPVALGVEELKSMGYRLPAEYDTAAKLCRRAFEYLTTDTTNGTSVCTPAAPCRSQLYHLGNYKQCGSPTGDTCNVSQRATSDSITTYTARSPAAFYLTPVLAYDWCHSEWSAAQRQTIANAFYQHHLDKWVNGLGAGKTILNTANSGNSDTTHGGRWFQFADDQLFAIAAWGDTDVLDAAKRQELYDAFYQNWINRFLWDTNNLSGAGWSYYAGTDYWYYGQLNAMAPMAAIDTALDASYTEVPWFSQQGRGMAAWFWPEGTGRSTGCGTTGTDPCPPYQEPWGYNTYTLGPGSNTCRAGMMAVGFPRFMGMVTGKALYNEDAAVGRWAFDNFVGRQFSCAVDTRLASTIVNSTWANAVWRWFLFGIEGISPQKPAVRDVQLGSGYYIFRNDYTVDDTFVFFGAQHYVTGGHDSKELGSFALHKFGPLAIKAGNVRSGHCTVPYPNGWRALYQNTVGIHSGDNDIHMAPDAFTPEPVYQARGIAGIYKGTGAPPRSSFGARYSYVSADLDPVWTKATTMQREFAYLRGTTNHEYLVILDRANVSNTLNDPVWKMWVTAQPACVDAACANPRAGKWTTSGKIVSVTNQRGPTPPIGSYGGGSLNPSGGGYLLPEAHGRLFLKALLPQDARVQMLGDDGTMTKMFQSGNDDGTSVMTSACPPGHYDIYGWGRIEVRPGAVGKTNTFLNVIQFGDSRTMKAMSPADTVESESRAFVVARIADPLRNRVVVFAKDATSGPREARLSYGFVPTTPESDHLVLNLEPNATYFVSIVGDEARTISVTKTAGGGTAYQADSAGALSFAVVGGTVVAPPRAPRNVRIP